jgi:beta-1,4-mannosyl-glycoprotein beta-1,4-N-acetylglucosaminyltransferase
MTAEESPKDDNPWCREKYQRKCIMRGLDGVPDSAIIMLSDLDEIPNMKIIPFEKLPYVVNSVHMWMFEYSFDHLFTGEPWIGTVITTCEIFKRCDPNYFRDNRWKFPCIQFAGWHLSSFGNAAHVALKHKTFAHWKDSRDLEMSEETFTRLIEQGLHTDGRIALAPRPDIVPLPVSTEILKRLGLGKF